MNLQFGINPLLIVIVALSSFFAAFEQYRKNILLQESSKGYILFDIQERIIEVSKKLESMFDVKENDLKHQSYERLAEILPGQPRSIENISDSNRNYKIDVKNQL